MEQKGAKGAKSLSHAIFDSKHWRARVKNDWSGHSEEKCEKDLADMADIEKTLEITGLARHVYVRQLAELRTDLAEKRNRLVEACSCGLCRRRNLAKVTSEAKNTWHTWHSSEVKITWHTWHTS